MRAARICSRDQRGPLGDGLVTVFTPVGLDEDAVDVFEVHDAGLVADGFNERTQAQVAGAAQETFTRADDGETRGRIKCRFQRVKTTFESIGLR